MAKKIKTKKEGGGNKEITQTKDKEIKEKISNKGDDSLKNAQIIELETTQKTPQIIDDETTQKSEQIDEEPAKEIDTDDLVNVLKVPMVEAKEKTNKAEEIKEAIFDSESEDDDEDEEPETENLNDKYFKDTDDYQSADDFDNQFFEDEKLMSEMAVEVIDLGMQYLAMGIAQDFENPEKYQVSEYKKNKIKKPLQILLRKRGTKVSPEIMFGVVLLVVYSPMVILAVQERKEKQKLKKEEMAKNKKRDSAKNIPPNIIEVDHEEIINRQKAEARQRAEANAQKQATITPMVVPEQPKSKGRPKGSKDSKKRSTKGYKGNTNAK